MTVKVSVVVPARNEESSIAALLDSLLRQSRPAAEIIVVDAGSVDRTAQSVREYRSAAIPVRLITIGPAFPGIARNAGVAAAAWDYIAFTDAGIQLGEHWLEKLCAALDPDRNSIALPSCDVVFGSYEPVISTFLDQSMATAYVPASSKEPGKEIRGPVIASCLIRRSVIDAAGGFAPYRAAEDLIFFESIRRKEWKVAYAPAAIAHWRMASGWTSTYRRFTLYSYHNLIAGRARHWHRGVALYYALAAPFLILGWVNRSAWLAVPVFGACGRVGLTLWRKRKEHWGAAFNPLRWITVGVVLLLLDAATVSGAVRWAWASLRGSLPGPFQAHSEKSRGATPA